MKTLAWILASLLCLAGPLAAQTSNPAPSPQRAPAPATPQARLIEQRVETYLRKLYAWGPAFHIRVGPPRETPISDLLEFSVEVSKGQEHDTAAIYTSKDGRYMFRGEISDLTRNPLAENLAKIRIQDSPAYGAADAKVTIVEFSDFQCPSCRQLHDVLRTIRPRYPQIRVVFKDFPLVQIHPWAMTAAIAARCAYQQSPEAFWKVYDSIYDHQQDLSAENLWDKTIEYAADAKLDADTFRACLSSPEATTAVQDNLRQGQALAITSTPTLFINGRRLVGADQTLIEQYIQYELAQKTAANSHATH